MYVNVDAGTSFTFNASSSPMTLYTNTNDTLVTTTNFTPTLTGLHQIKFWATSDSFPTTDTIGRSTIVTDTIYGVDFDWDSDGENAGSGYYLGRTCGGQVLGNVFDIYTDDTATSISFHVHEDSRVGALINVELYELDPFTTQSQVWLEGSDDYAITQNDIDSWVTVKLASPVSLLAGTTYLAAVRGYANPIDTSLISSSSTDNTSSYVQDNGCDIGSGGFGYWYTLSKSLLIRMNLGYEVVSSLSNPLVSRNLDIHPNPSNGVFKLDLLDVVSEDYEIKISNVLGEIVYNKKKEVNSTTSIQIDISEFAKGVYILNVNNSQSSISRKIIIE